MKNQFAQSILVFVVATLFLTSDPIKKTPQQKFPCEGKIYAYVTFPKNFSGKHVVEGSWIRPDGEEQERTHLDLEFEPQGSKTAYIWFQFKEDSLLGSVKMGSYDDSKTGFNGTWTLKIFSDQSLVAQSTYTIVCSK